MINFKLCTASFSVVILAACAPIVAQLPVPNAQSSGTGAPIKTELPEQERSADAIRRSLPILAPRLQELGAQAGDPIFMRAFKTEKILELWIQPSGRGPYVQFATWPICAASGVLGPKLREGDKQVLEGFYAIPASAMNNASSYHLSMNTGYPNAFDQSLGRTGSLIMVHGRCASVGCLAMTDPIMDQIWTLVSTAHARGQIVVPIHIFPFVMSETALAAQTNSPHFAFWSDLARVNNQFETTSLPPRVTIHEGRYQLAAP